VQFATYFAQESLFRFDSTAPVLGRQAIKETLITFSGSITKLQHRVTGIWQSQWEHGEMISTRKDGIHTEVLPATTATRLIVRNILS